MRDIAARAGVSISTVSHVVNNTRRVAPETKRRVVAAMAEVGYDSNGANASAARSIGVAVSALSNPYLVEVVGAIERAVARRGGTALVGETHESAGYEHHLVETMLNGRVDGVILAPGARSVARTLPALTAADVPVVLVDRMVAADSHDQVGSENCEPVAAAVDHLVGHGHRRIAFIAGLGGLATSRERQQGYQLGLLRNGLTPDPALIAPGGSLAGEAAAAVARLLSMHSAPTAVITANNAMTVGVLKHLAGTGVRVPDELALIGYDDFDLADLLAVPVTAIAQDWSAIGTAAVDMVFDRIAVPDRPVASRRIATAFVPRRSCGCGA